jgi:amino acid adenylation domain-containing protein
MTLLAAFKVLLFRYSGQNDIIVGSATDARRRPELEPVVGYFLDTYAIRTKPTAELSFIDLLLQTRDAVLGGLAAADVPFDRVVHAVNPKRNASQHPIFQAFFTIRPPAPQLPKGWDFTQTDVTVGASKFYLYLELGERPDRMQARFFYIANIWDSSTIKRMAAHWLILLRSICDNSATAIGDLAILTPEEHRDIFEAGGWNDTAWLTPQAPLNMLFEEQVRRTPRAVASTCKDERWTYEELNARADELASWLRAAGVKRGSIVAIMLDRSLDLLASLIAVHKAGAAYLPIDIHMPAERIALFLTKAEPAAIVTQRSLRKQIPSDQNIVIVDEDRDRHTELKDLPDTAQAEAANDLEDIAYVIFTSGTTGEPKGVEISQRSLVNLLLSMQISPGFSSADVLLAVTPVSFDIAALELFLPIICGGTVAIATREEAQDPHLLASAMRHSDCTVMQATPTTWRALLLSGWKDAHVRASHESGKMLRVLCGGESLPRDLAVGLLATGAELWNMYGPTETTIWSLIHRIHPATKEDASQIAVGRPIANTQAYILDTQRHLQPMGVPGELFLGGLGLARGYRGDPGKTASRFPNVSAVMNARLYSTGDHAVQHADGTITVLGRTDNQVKVRGHRIELEEVEAAILRHPNVAHAAARVWPESTGDMRLSSYIVVQEGPPPNVAEMRRFLSEILPDSMIPSDVIAMPTIPLTPHGKIDRAKLPAPTTDPAPSKPIRLSGPQEIRLAQIWGELLDRKYVGPMESFFDLGGHSVLVAVLQRKIFVEFGQRIPIAKLFHSPTVRQQAELLAPVADGQAAMPPGVIALQPRGSRRGIFWVHYLNGDLAQEMGEDQPFFSLALTAEDIAILGKSPSVEDIAACQVVKILATQPEGPYIIGGLCASGNVGFEIASQLQRAGHEVSLLIILDAKNASHPEPIEPVALKLKQMRYSWKRTRRVGYGQSIIDLRKRILKRLALITKKQYAKTELGIAQEIIEAAARTYNPQKYEGNVLLLLASDRPPGVDFLEGWQAVASNKLQVHYVQGHHSDLIHLPCVRSVADTIKSELDLLS